MRSQATTDMIYYKNLEIYIFVFPLSLMMTFWKSKHVAGDNVRLTYKKKSYAWGCISYHLLDWRILKWAL